jgi:hypothetical protein
MPIDLQLAILEYIPLAELARLATLSKGIRAAYKDRLQERQTCISAGLAQGWPEEVTEGLSAADIAVPRDFVVTPLVSFSTHT